MAFPVTSFFILAAGLLRGSVANDNWQLLRTLRIPNAKG
jgi:hypothetical protein